MGSLLIIFGILMVIVGIFLSAGTKLHLPVLPGDIYVHKDNFTFYFPIVTALIVSVIATIIINLFR